jgi:hypothetical protein
LETLDERILILNERSVCVVHRSEEDYVDSFKALENVGAFPHAQLESGSYAAQPGAGRGFAHDLHGRTGPNTVRARMIVETTITTSMQIKRTVRYCSTG